MFSRFSSRSIQAFQATLPLLGFQALCGSRFAHKSSIQCLYQLLTKYLARELLLTGDELSVVRNNCERLERFAAQIAGAGGPQFILYVEFQKCVTHNLFNFFIFSF